MSGSLNAFFGNAAGLRNTGSDNSFFGGEAGAFNTTGGSNVFIGRNAGSSNSIGNNNTLVGASANLDLSNLSFATAIGAGAIVSSNNTVVLGRPVDSVRIPGTVSGTLSANVLNATQYNIAGTGVLRLGAGQTSIFAGVGAGAITTGASNSFFGYEAGSNMTTGQLNTFVGRSAGTNAIGGQNAFFGANSGLNSTGADNTFLGTAAGLLNTTGIRNTFVGRSAGATNTGGNDNTLIGHDAGVGSGNLTFATAIGANAVVSNSNSVVLGRPGGEDAVRIPGAVIIDGSIVVRTLGTPNTAAQLCLNTADRISPCSSSSRYKTNINSFGLGLDLVNRLKPISFDWKDGGMHDLGLGAEDVAAIEPLLVTYNAKGEIEGVKYDRIGVVLINAVKEQQAMIEAQQKQIELQRQQIDALTKLVCESKRRSSLCGPRQ